MAQISIGPDLKKRVPMTLMASSIKSPKGTFFLEDVGAHIPLKFPF